MKLNKVIASNKILLSELRHELYSVPNPRYAILKMELSEVDFFTPNEKIGKTSISIENLRKAVIKHHGNVQYKIVFQKGRTKAIRTLSVRCNKE